MPEITALRPVTRSQGTQIPGLVAGAEWIDAMVLAATVAETYTLPTDAEGNRGTILGITANNSPLYINFAGVAAAPGTEIVDGTASVMLRTDTSSYLITVPGGATTLSLMCPTVGGAVVTIEVWK